MISSGSVVISEHYTRILICILLAMVTLVSSKQINTDGVFHCGQRMNNTHGYVTTPNFPNPFPVPLSCRWIFYAPPGQKVVLYFTQYYVRDHFYIKEYDYYLDESMYAGRTDIGEVSVIDDHVIFLQGFKSYVVVEFRVAEMGNIHIRVDDFLLNVYGFNFTYEIMDATKTVRKDVCSVHKCSFLGNCLASRNFHTYQCHCFEGYYGDECQYGPYCDPNLGQNVCHNGGKCRYFWGSLVNICECPPGFYGPYCELKEEGFLNSECEELGCNQKCIKHHNKKSECACEDGYKLQKDNQTCIELGLVRYNCSIRMIENPHHKPLPTCHIEEEIKIEISFLSIILEGEFHNITVNQARSENGYRYYALNFLCQKYGNALFILRFYAFNRTVCGYEFDPVYYECKSELGLHALSVQIHHSSRIVEDGLLTLMCKVKGSERVEFVWYKDGALVDVHMTARNMWETQIPSNDGETRMSVLNIDGVLPQDEGVFTCQVSDWKETIEKSVSVKVTRKSTVEITPLAASYDLHKEITILCASYDDANADMKYEWLINSKPIIPGTERPNNEVVEDIFPTGSRVKIASLETGANYTCLVSLGQDKIIYNTSIISVIKDSTFCPSIRYLGVTWSRTNGSAADVTNCPSNAVGMAKRKCVCHRNCTWIYPDFSNCTSINATNVYNQMKIVTLGYQQYKLNEILQNASQYLDELKSKTDNITIMGDLNSLSYTLWKLQEYKTKFRLESSESFSLTETMTVAEKLLDIVSPLTTHEKKHITVMPYLIKTLDNVKQLEVDNREYITVEGKGRHLDIRGSKCHIRNSTDPYIWHVHKHTSVKVELPVVNSASNFFNLNAISVTYDDRRYQNTTFSTNETFLNSEAVHVDIFKDDPPFLQHIPLNYTITYFHSQETEQTREDYCVVWKFTNFPEGEWHPSDCTVTESTSSQTTCQCTWSGLYALFSKYITHKDDLERGSFVLGRTTEIVLLIPVIGFAFCIFLNIYLAIKKDENKSTYLMLLNLSFALACLSVTLFIGNLSNPIIKSFYLAAITSLMANVVVEMVKSHLKDTKLIFAVFISVAWGMPITFFIVTIIHRTKTSINGLNCLPVRNDNIFLCSKAIGTVISFILCALHTVYTYQSVKNDRKHKWHHIFILLRCFITLLLLLLIVITVFFKDQLPFLILETTLLISVFILWTPISNLSKMLQRKFPGHIENWRSCCYSVKFSLFSKLKRQNSTTSSFKAFVRPETNSLKTQCSDSFNDVYERDQKFTRDRKAQLSSLLGTSSSEDSGEVFSIPTRVSSANGFIGYGFNIDDIEEVPLKPEKGKCYIVDSNEL